MLASTARRARRDIPARRLATSRRSSARPPSGRRYLVDEPVALDAALYPPPPDTTDRAARAVGRAQHRQQALRYEQYD